MNAAKTSLSAIPTGTVEVWRQYEKLFKEAVNKNHYFGLEKLLENEHLVPSIEEFKKRCCKPLIIAIANKNVNLINLMCKYGYKLPEPHPRKCQCDVCNGNRFGQIKGQMAALKALCNPVWISVSSEDPFETIFKLKSMDVKFERVSGSFAMEFEELFKKTEQFCVALINQIKTEEEGLTLMRHKTIASKSECQGMEFINLALENKQKHVIAESEIQYHIESKVFCDIPYWDNSGFLYKVLVTILIAILSPITCLLNILLPSKIFPSVSKFALRPYVKFVNATASFITFITMLIVMGASERNGIREDKTPTGLEIAIFIWLIGFCAGEMKEMYQQGIKGYLNNGWNRIDIAMDFLMLVSYIIWFVLHGVKTHHSIDDDHYDRTMFIADGTFCVAIVLSFYRLLYLCQASSYLGLMQICLGEMVFVIWQFMFVAIVNLFGFTVAMVYLFHSAEVHRIPEERAKLEAAYKDKSAIYSTFMENFYGFFSTMFTLIYLSLGVADTTTLKNFQEGTLLHLWANLFFIVYVGVSMIVLLNMLIAMMSSSYQLISDNIHTEHLFSQTKLWMEYIGHNRDRPVPLNLIPHVQTILDIIKGTYWCCSTPDDTASLEEEEKRRYKSLCSALVKRYLKSEFGCPDVAEPPEASGDIDNDPFIKKINAICREWEDGCSDAQLKKANGVIAGNVTEVVSSMVPMDAASVSICRPVEVIHFS